MSSRAGITYSQLVPALGGEELSYLLERHLRAGTLDPALTECLAEGPHWKEAVRMLCGRVLARLASGGEDEMVLRGLGKLVPHAIDADGDAARRLIELLVSFLDSDDGDESSLLAPWLEYLPSFDRTFAARTVPEVLCRSPRGETLTHAVHAAVQFQFAECSGMIAEILRDHFDDYQALLEDLLVTLPGGGSKNTIFAERELKLDRPAGTIVVLQIERRVMSLARQIDSMLTALVKLRASCASHVDLWRAIAEEGPEAVGWEAAIVLLGRSSPEEAAALVKRFGDED